MPVGNPKSELPVVDEPRAERCETCRFWDDFKCKRYPPVAAGFSPRDSDHPHTTQAFFFWPDVDHDEWCGEWQAKAGERAVETDYLSIDEVARILDIRLNQAKKLIQSGQLKGSNVGPSKSDPCWITTRAALDRFVASRASQPEVPHV